jgi:hypothetical protein
MKKQPIFIKKQEIFKKVVDFREKNDTIILHEDEKNSLAVEVNHYGGVFLVHNGKQVAWEIGSEKIIDAYIELHKELFDGKWE